MRTPDGRGFLKQAKHLFICGTEAIMTGCSSYHHQWPFLRFKPQKANTLTPRPQLLHYFLYIYYSLYAKIFTIAAIVALDCCAIFKISKNHIKGYKLGASCKTFTRQAYFRSCSLITVVVSLW